MQHLDKIQVLVSEYDTLPDNIYLAYDTSNTDNRPIGALTKPSYLSSVIDPEYGSKIFRVTGDDGVAVPNVSGQTWRNVARHGYSSRPVWNSDQSVLYLEKNRISGGAWENDLFLNGSTYAVIKVANLPSGNEHRWHPTDSDKFLIIRDTEVVEWSYSLETETQLTSFAGYTSLSMGYTGNFSKDGNSFCVYARRTSDSKQVIFGYDISTDTKHPDIDATGVTIDYTTISCNGSILVLNGDFGTGEDRTKTYTKTTGALLQYFTERGLPSHFDVAEVDGEQFAVGVDKVSANEGSIIKRNLTTGVVTVLTPYGGYFSHTSCRNINQGGYAVSIGAESASWLPYYNEIVVIALDGSAVYRIAHARSELVNYENETQPCFSPNGDKIMIASDWDNDAVPIQGYVIEI